MNLETLRQKILGQTTTVTVGGESYRLSKLGAADGMEVHAFMQGMEMKGEGDNKEAKNPKDVAQLYLMLLSRTILDDTGKKALDSDEGRALLANLPHQEFIELGEAAMTWSVGENGAQKKS